MLIVGAVLPFAMMMTWVPSTFPLNLLAVLSSLIGSIVGLYGLFMYVRSQRKRQ